MSDLPAINQEAIDQIFISLERMEIKLEENPLEFGPRHLNQKTAQARKFLADTESIFLKVSSWIQKYKAAHRAAETLLELNKKDLYTNDPETRAGRNFSDREAIASVKLRAEVEELSRIVSVLEDLGAVLAAIKSKRADLKDIQGRIRDQIKLCQEEIGLGGRWGSRPPPGVKAPELDGGARPESLRDLKNLFEASYKDPVLVPDSEPEPKGLEPELTAAVPPPEDLPVAGDPLDDLFKDESEDPLDDLFKDEKEPSPSPVVSPTGNPPSSGNSKTPSALTEDSNKDRIVRILEEVEQGAEGFPQIGFCAVCEKPQFETPSGPVCENGHGGAETITHPLRGKSTDREVDSLLDEVESPKEGSKQELDIDSILNEFGLD